jgi:hypothetical protein
MQSISAAGLLILVCAMLAWSGRSTGAADGGKPAAPGDRADPEAVQWRAHCDLDDGRRFITDGSLLLEARVVPDVAVPEKSVPAKAAQRLLESKTDREFGLKDLQKKTADGHYLAPGEIQLNGKYVELLKRSKRKDTVRFAAKGPDDPVLIMDGRKAVGVMMPMKKPAK